MKSPYAVFVAAAVGLLVLQASGTAQSSRGGDDQTLTYVRGQAVVPIFHGWLANGDDTATMYFSYINRNWQEEVDIPIGPNNDVTAPFGPDAGQPTHFLPRQNRWVFTVTVPKNWGMKEVVWTLTSHGQTLRAYGALHPGYAVDNFLMQYEFGSASTKVARERKPPSIKVEGDTQRNVKVGASVPLNAVVIDQVPANGRVPAVNERGEPRRPGDGVPGGVVGGDFVRQQIDALWFTWLVYRGPSRPVKFNPPMPFKAWEDQRGGSPWSPGFQAPPIPPGNRWVHNVSFSEPGTYVLRGFAHNGATFAYANITFNVSQ